jgi:hypothetical protein
VGEVQEGEEVQEIQNVEEKGKASAAESSCTHIKARQIRTR